MQTSIAATALTLATFTVSALAQQGGPGDDSGSDPSVRCFNGYGYTLEGGEYRYTEHHEQTLKGGDIETWNVDYVGTAGERIATKQMDFSANDTVPTYTLEIFADSYREGIRRKDGRWTLFRRESSNADEETEHFEIDPPMAADSGFNALVQQNFDRLVAGQTVPFRFAAAGRLAVIKLRAKRSGETTFEGERAVVFVAELDMFLINLFVDSLELTYDPESMRLLEYRGIGNMHNASGEVYPVRVTYASEMPEVARANGAPDARCGSIEG